MLSRVTVGYRPVNKSQRFKALLETGYFPEELPPPFTTSDIATYRGSIATAWAALPGEYPKTVPAQYSNPRVKNSRRILSIVNPIAQLNISKLIADHWVEIKRRLRRTKYAIEELEIKLNEIRAVPPPDRTLLGLRRLEISAAYDHVLLADISRFYGTLYTHAIPWALHTKNWCKSNLNNKAAYEGTLGARLDKAVRKGQDNQTLGIPVGPDTSRIISEIVGVAIDENLPGQLSSNGKRAFRFVDDWHIGFDSIGEAESAVASIAAACRIYELELNFDKTRILNSSSSVGTLWPIELREHRFHTTTFWQSRSLDHYFTMAFQFAEDNPEDNVLDFAVKRSNSVWVKPDNWHSYETFLLRAVRLNPTVLPAVVQILVSYNYSGYIVGKERIKKLIEDFIEKSVPLAPPRRDSVVLVSRKSTPHQPTETNSRRCVDGG